ncbi:MAG: AMP-binding protein [Opitutales bacterium]|nr:AMP-binding protein [Opitutales bacterium]
MFSKQRFHSYEDFQQSFRVDVPERFNFAFDVIDEKARSAPHQLAMIHVDNHGTRRDYDFEYFARESARFAHGLESMGVGRGDKVMLLLYRRVEFWTATLALHRIGAIAIPSSFMLTGQDIEERVNFANVKCLIVEHGLCSRVEEARAKCPCAKVFVDVGEAEQILPGWLRFEDVCHKQPTHFARSRNSPGGEDPLLIFFSSGTTGLPKMVEHSHRYPVSHYTTGAYWHDLVPGDIHLTVSDTGWGKSMWGKFYGQWMADAVVFVYDFRDKFMPRNLLRMIADHGVTTLCAPPTVYRFLVLEDFSHYDLSHLRHCTTAGEPLNESISSEWMRKLGLPIYEGFGQTETTLLIATFPFMKVKPGKLGRPVAGWDVRLLDYDDKPCECGEEGEICVSLSKGHPVGLFDAYVKDEAKTAEACRNGFYHTGDKAVMDEDGYFTFLGRVDDLIKSAGYRIGPFEVESALVSHPAVVEAAVTSVPDDIRGQAVKATVVLAAGFTASDELTRELQKHVKNCTATYKAPRIIDYVKELPKTVSGKIKRAEIRAKDWQR